MNVTSKKKILSKAIQKPSKQCLISTDTAFQTELTDSFSDYEKCILSQGDRGRVIVFIDGANLFYAATDLKIEIDYVKMLNYLVANACLVHVLFYTGNDSTNEKQQRFLQGISCSGFRVISRPVIQAPDSAKKANLDVEIAVDMMKLAPHCDTAVLVSGDGDFAYVVNAIATQGVRVEVVGLRSMTSATLIDAANCYTDLATIRQAVEKTHGDVCYLLSTAKS